MEWEPIPEKSLSYCNVPTKGLDMCPVRWDSTTTGAAAIGDIRVYLMWSGTDARGRTLNSVGTSAASLKTFNSMTERSIYKLQYYI